MSFSTKALIALSATILAGVAIVQYTNKREREELEVRRRRVRAKENMAKTG
jgi:hypothetical protein